MAKILMSSNIAFLVILSLYTNLSHSVSISDIHNRIARNAVGNVPGLYNASDYVEELVESSIKNIYGSNRVWFMEFYNTWCGHCRKYAPTYKAVAEYFRYANDILAIAALDCANEINVHTCRNFEIMGYPTLRYFHENYLEGPQNLGLTVIKENDEPSSNIQLVIDTIISEQVKGRAQMIPNLQLYNHSDISKIFNDAGPEVKFAFLIIENDILLGVQTILYFHKVPDILITYALKSNVQLIKSLSLTNLPALLIISREGLVIKDKLTNVVSLKEPIIEFLKHQGLEVDKYITEDANKPENRSFEKDPSKTEEQEIMDKVKKMGDVVFQMDLETALRFSLRQEISRTKIIEGDKLKALRDYLKILVKYFPIGKNGHYFLKDLSLLVTNSDSVMGTEISSLVKDSEKEGKFIWSSPKEWLGCKGSTTESRGYPCGVWTMFHYLTVNAAEQNIGRVNADPKEILMAMHGYIKFFFGCADCSKHFQQMAVERKIDQVSSSNDAIMWLWAAHNVVNERLAGDPTEDPMFPKKQFPTVERCPECRFKNNSWNYNQVEEYMKHMYSSINIRYIGTDMKVIHSEVVSSYNSNGIFGPIDRSCKWLMILPVYLGYVYASH